MRQCSAKIAVILLLVGATGAQAAQRIPLSAAMAQCEKQSIKYTHTIGDSSGEHPVQRKLDHHYRTCVYAKSGKYPPQAKQKGGIRVTGSAAIGIVVQD